MTIYSDKIVRTDSYEEDIQNLVKEFLPDFGVNDLRIKVMPGGTSNTLYSVFKGQKMVPGVSEVLLFRVYGDIPLDRDLETRNMISLSKYDLAAPVVGQFGNGVSYRFIHGDVLTVDEMVDEDLYPLIIKEMARLHSVCIDENNKEPMVFNMIRTFVKNLPERFVNESSNKRYAKEFPNKSVFLEDTEKLEAQLIELNPPIAFTHNDLLIRNLIKIPDRSRIRFIDFEYAGFNYAAFDIGNHFNEFAGFGGILEYSRFPSVEFQRKWISIYLQEMSKIKQSSISIDGDVFDPNSDVVSYWYRCVCKGSLLSHLLWVTWALLQEANSTIDFGYIDFASQRWQEYLRRRDDFMKI